MAGRKPTPTALKKLRGNPGHRPLNALEPRIDSDLPDCPRYLDPVAKARWRYEADLLTAAKVVTAADQGALEMRSYLYSQIYELRETLRREGRVIDVYLKDKNENVYLAGQKTHPAATQLMQCIKEFRLLGASLGLDPKSRAGLQVPEDIEEDDMEKFLKRNNGKKG